MTVPLFRTDLIDAIFDGQPLLAADGQTGEILFSNPAANSLFGYVVPGEILQLPSVDRLVPDAVRGQHRSHRAAYTKNPAMRPMGVTKALRGVRKDGSEFPCIVTLLPLYPPGRSLVVVALIAAIA